tara:strand:+ start:2087 stop:3298 length:1212 start_codon:yes stop_codon:yes gene_type:complete
MTQVNNKDIDNASGQVVRLDIQNTIKAVTTNNFGPRNDAGTILPCEFLADDTTNKLLIRKSSGGDQANPNPSSGTAATFFPVGNLDEDNLGLLPKSGGTMTGVLTLSHAGTSAAPSINFGDSNTGFFKIGVGSIGITAGGTFLGHFTQDAINISGQKELRLFHQSLINQKYLGFKAPQTLSNSVTFTLPDGDGSAGEVLKTDGSGNLSFSAVQGVPSGAVFCMAVATVPPGYLECNGDPVSRSTYAALFAVIGTEYNTGGETSSEFRLPDLRGEFIRGFDNGRNVDVVVDSNGNSSSRGIATSQSEQNKQHSHSASSSSSVSPSSHGHTSTKLDNNRVYGHKMTGANIDGQTSPYGSPGNIPGFNITNLVDDTTITVSTSTSVGDEGGENRPRNISMMYVIKT